MLVTFETQTRPGRPNEDFVVAAESAVIVLDGAGPPDGTEQGCTHGVRWFVQRLGLALTRQVIDEDQDLVTALAVAINETAANHADCDLTHPQTPSATVAITRINRDRLHWLVLADSYVVVDATSGLQVHTDDRLAQVTSGRSRDLATLTAGSREYQQRYAELIIGEQTQRNRAGGFWVASATPEAADQALTGSLPLQQVRRFAVLTDGATRLVDRFGLMSWTDCLDLLEHQGPRELIRRVRDAENTDPDGHRWRRRKRHDDATAAFCRP
jgi:Protein phosphatase 2C